MLPYQTVQTVKIYHLPTTGGANQPYPTNPDLTLQAAVLPLDRKDYALEGVEMVDPWDLYFESQPDIRLQDKVLLANEDGDFYVRHIFKANLGILRHLRVTVSKAV